MISNLLNNEILSKTMTILTIPTEYGNKNRRGDTDSGLERMFKHLALCQDVLYEANNHSGKQFTLNVNWGLEHSRVKVIEINW